MKPVPADGMCWKTSRTNNPNAYCPVCSQPVYFVETENGGRVFFDELGPPWPKHPCTDNNSAPFHLVVNSCNSAPTKQSNDWFLLGSPTIKLENEMTIIEGHCKTLGKHLRLRAEIDNNVNIFPPILVKPLGHTGAFELSYLCSIVQEKQIKTENRLFYPSIPNDVAIWKRAFGGDGEAENELGWYYSFFWDAYDNKYEYAKDYKIARYWFSRAASHGNSSGMNNMGVIFLRGHSVEIDEEFALQYFLKSALQMTSTAFGHLDRIYEKHTSFANHMIFAELFFAVERHLQIYEFNSSRNPEEADNQDSEYLDDNTARSSSHDAYIYAPLSINRYIFIETINRLSQMDDYVPLWNLFWLSTDGLEQGAENPLEWHSIVNIPRGLVDAMLFDMDTLLSEGVTFRDALRMHPRRFLHYFQCADLSMLDIAKQNNNWVQSVTEKAISAAKRVVEPSNGKLAKVLSIKRPPGSQNRK